MGGFLTKGKLSILLIFIILLIDQIIKIAVKTHMCLHESFSVCGDWFYILFTENPGMAFGMELFDKLFLTCFRIAAVIAIGYAMYLLIKKGIKTGYLVCLSLIWAGAMGNIFDSTLYGLVFSESFPATFWNQDPAHWVPFGEGYSSIFYGKVVDMFYFPLIEAQWPEWMPVVGGGHFIFFSPIFNFADASISCGMIAMILFYRKDLDQSFSALFPKKKEQEEPDSLNKDS